MNLAEFINQGVEVGPQPWHDILTSHGYVKEPATERNDYHSYLHPDEPEAGIIVHATGQHASPWHHGETERRFFDKPDDLRARLTQRKQRGL
jgi:hypothetical protein